MKDEAIEAMYNQLLQRTGIPHSMQEHMGGADEFHVGGQEATRQMAATAGISPGSTILDLGCGIGGPARLLASEYQCTVTGIDLTSAFIETATRLSELAGLQHITSFVQGSVLALPFCDAAFDTVWTQHVQMNIADKTRFYNEAARVLKPGGKFVYYDILATGNGPILYPVPWAIDETMSFLISSEALHQLLTAAGLVKQHTQTIAPPTVQDSSRRWQNLSSNFNNGLLILESGVFIKP